MSECDVTVRLTPGSPVIVRYDGDRTVGIVETVHPDDETVELFDFPGVLRVSDIDSVGVWPAEEVDIEVVHKHGNGPFERVTPAQKSDDAAGHDGDELRCDVGDCTFSTDSAHGLAIHKGRVHDDGSGDPEPRDVDLDVGVDVVTRAPTPLQTDDGIAANGDLPEHVSHDELIETVRHHDTLDGLSAELEVSRDNLRVILVQADLYGELSEPEARPAKKHTATVAGEYREPTPAEIVNRSELPYRVDVSGLLTSVAEHAGEPVESVARDLDVEYGPLSDVLWKLDLKRQGVGRIVGEATADQRVADLREATA